MSIQAVWYLLVLPHDFADETDPLSAFNMYLLHESKLIQGLGYLPGALMEGFISTEARVFYRARGTVEVHTLVMPAMAATFDLAARCVPWRPCVVVVATAGTLDWVKSRISTITEGERPLLVDGNSLSSLVPRGGLLKISTDIMEHSSTAFERQSGEGAFHEYVGFDKGSVEIQDSPDNSWTCVDHAFLRPALATLGALGVRPGKMVGSGTDEDLQRSIADAARRVVGLLRKPGGMSGVIPARTTAVIWAPQYVGALKSTDLAGGLVVDAEVRRELKRLTKFSGYWIKVTDGESVEASVIRVRESAVRAQELTGGLVGLLAAPNMAPTLVCRPNGADVYGDVTRLLDCVEGAGPHRQVKASRLFRQLSQKLGDIAVQPFEEMLFLKHQHVKLVGDAPLEWSDVDGLPLMLRYPCSRIPLTPGDVLAQQVLHWNSEVHLFAQDLKAVLVLRTSMPDDPIYGVLEMIVEEFRKNAPDASVELVDIRDVEHLVDVLDRTHCPIAILDGHGMHGRNEVFGTLDTPSGPGHLFGKLKAVPPVVFLAACSTSRFDRAPWSVATSLMAAGVKSVVATTIKVDAVKSALLASRLVFRAWEQVPLVTANRGIRWTEVFSGAVRRVYFWEGVDQLARVDGPLQKIARSLSLEVRNQATFNFERSLSTSSPGWFEATMAFLAKETSTSAELWESEWRRVAMWTESLAYLHMGIPEQILILPDSECS